MSKIEIEGSIRNEFGTGPARKVRGEHMVPAIIYAKGQTPIACAVSKKELSKIARKANFWSTLINLKLEENIHQVIPAQVQQHPLTDEITHIDFMFVNADSQIKVHVNLHFIGQEKSVDIKRGGILNIIRRNIDVICSPDNIISEIQVDVSTLVIGHSLHVKDLVLPEGVVSATSSHETIAVLAGRSSEEESK